MTPGASNVIPGEVRFSLDVRAANDEARSAAVEEIRGGIREIGARRGVVIGMETVLEKPVAVCAPAAARAHRRRDPEHHRKAAARAHVRRRP